MVTAQEASESMDAFHEFMRTRIAPNPSPRNPKFSRDVNSADVIEAQYQEDGHRTWGFVIYRSTYESDADWEEVMNRLRFWASDCVELFNGQDVIDKMTWTVFDDRSLFDGVQTARIRQHFQNWCLTAPMAEQGTADPGRSARYRYCVQIDTESLRSILQEPAPPDMSRDTPGWVKLILKGWLPVRENPIFVGRELDPEVYPPVEGMTEQHVGFIRVTVYDVMFGFYMSLRDPNYYFVSERRPPEITT